MNKKAIFIPLLLVLIGLVIFWFSETKFNFNNQTDNKINVVAAENFWGSLVSQIGGQKINLLSIIVNPNVDPHEYESNVNDSIAITKANYLIVNGEGYDDWAIKDAQSSNNSSRVLLNVQSFLGIPNGQNPHFWYNPTFVQRVAKEMLDNLIQIKPKDKSYFLNNYKVLENKLSVYLNNINYIRTHFNLVKVSSTESIFVYYANYAHLDLISPSAFMNAVSEGIDPSASSVIAFQNQIESHQIKLLIYNTQTITPLTANMRSLALKYHIPIVGISETISPNNLNFENWMNKETVAIIQALKS